MAEEELTDEQVISHMEKVLEALEPWLMQMLKWNPYDKYMATARRETATMLVKLEKEFYGD